MRGSERITPLDLLHCWSFLDSIHLVFSLGIWFLCFFLPFFQHTYHLLAGYSFQPP
jgi:hypothetical protein